LIVFPFRRVALCSKEKLTHAEAQRKWKNNKLISPYHFGIEDSSIYKIRDRNKTNGIHIHHGLRCIGIPVCIKIVLAPFPWLPIFRHYVAFISNNPNITIVET
jgi:hypothetical protein